MEGVGVDGRSEAAIYKKEKFVELNKRLNRLDKEYLKRNEKRMNVQELRDKKERLVARYHKVAKDKPPNWWRRCERFRGRSF